MKKEKNYTKKKLKNMIFHEKKKIYMKFIMFLIFLITK